MPNARRVSTVTRPRTAASTERRTPLWRLAPWRLAPWLGLRSPAAVAAVVVTTTILVLAVASAPLFLSSARSAALQQQLAGRCAEVGWAQTGIASALADAQGRPLPPDAAEQPATDQQLMQGWRNAGYVPEPVLATALVGRADPRGLPTVLRGPGGAALSQPVTFFYRPDALRHVTVVGRASTTTGIWLPESVAGHDGVHPGQQVSLGDERVSVAGVYRDLYETSAHDPYWCDYRLLFLNEASTGEQLPAIALVSDPDTFYRLAGTVGWADRLQQVHIDPATLTATRARALQATGQRLLQQAHVPVYSRVPSYTGGVPNNRLPALIDRAQLIERGVHGTVLPVAFAGGLLALLLVAAAGGGWAERRMAEVRLLAARGVGPFALGVKAGLEMALPAVGGAALGWAAARVLVGGLGPAHALDPAASAQAGWAAAAAAIVGLVCAATVAGLRARASVERVIGSRPRWPAELPWELLLLAGALICWLLLQHRPAVVLDAYVAQVNPLVVAFPLLAVAGAAALLARMLTGLLPAVRRRATRGSTATFLAVNRLAAARAVTAALLIAVTLPVAVLGYTGTLTASSSSTLTAKIRVEIGARAAVTSVSRFTPTPAVRATGTYVLRFDGSVPAGAGGRGNVQVLGVDPATFAHVAFWDGSFADQPLNQLITALRGPAVDGRLPIVAAGLPLGDTELRVGTVPVPARVVATARVLPGRRTLDPLVYVAGDRLPEVPAGAGSDRTAEIWTNGPLDPAIAALTGVGAFVGLQLEPDTVREVADYLGITWTFGYLSALAVFVGIIAVGGLLLYLEARSRSRVSGYVMARRLGLSRGAHLRSLTIEIGAVSLVGLALGAALAAGAVATVYRLLDVDPIRPPTPLLAIPGATIAYTVAATALTVLLAALYAQHAADRAHPATVLREDA